MMMKAMLIKIKARRSQTDRERVGRCPLPRRFRGVSLLEVLVAIVVLSIGLLGLAGLQASGMRVGQSSIHRSQAAQLAYDMVDRMRANVANAASYDDAVTTRSTLVERDLQDWRRRLLALPGGAGAVAVDGSEVTIIVQWDDTRGAGVLRGTSDDDAARLAQQTSQFQIITQLAN
jgi:type IV pilus assembly protein PilV